MGTVKSIAQKKKGSFWDHKILRELAEELERYYSDPSSFDPKKLEALAFEFFNELKKVLKEVGVLSQMKQGLKSKAPTAFGFLKKALHLIQSDEVDDFGLDRKFELSIKPFFDFLFTHYFRVSVSGIENIPNEGRALVVANHSGVLPYDAAMIKIAIFNEHPARRELRFLVDDFVFHF